MATRSAHSWRPRALGIATAAAAAGLGVGGVAPVAHATHDDGSSVTVTDDGDPANRVMLSTTPNVDDTARLARVVHSTAAAEAEGLSMTLDATSETQVQEHVAVQSVGRDGRYSALVTVESFDQTVDDRFGIGEEFDGLFPADLTPIVGVPVVQHYDAERVLVWAEAAPGTTLTSEQDDVLDALERGDDFAFPLVVPGTPVGQGATWVVSPPDEFAALFPFALDFELISVKGDRFVVDMSFQLDLADLADQTGMPPELEELSGEISGTARFSGVFDAPLLTSRSLQMHMDMVVSADGFDVAMTVDYALDETATPS